VNAITTLSKSKLRIKVKTILKNLTPDQLHAKSLLIYNSLAALDCYKQAELILSYISTDSEVQTARIIESALADGKMVYAPRISGKDLDFHLLQHADLDFECNRFGIREPAAALAKFNYEHIKSKLSIVIVPGLAFDRQKNRLGRGKGYYDRFLHGLKKDLARACTLVGICFSEQLYPALPFDQGDVPVDMVVTDQEIVS